MKVGSDFMSEMDDTDGLDGQVNRYVGQEVDWIGRSWQLATARKACSHNQLKPVDAASAALRQV